MRILLFLLLATPLVSQAQRTEWSFAFTNAIPENIGSPIHMPPRDYNPHFKLGKGIRDPKLGTSIHVIQEDSIYKKLFWRYVYTQDSLKKINPSVNKYQYHWMITHLTDSLPVIDFSTNELVLFSACAQCLAHCRDEDGVVRPCHRNACSYREAWFIRKKGPAQRNPGTHD